MTHSNQTVESNSFFWCVRMDFRWRQDLDKGTSGLEVIKKIETDDMRVSTTGNVIDPQTYPYEVLTAVRKRLKIVNYIKASSRTWSFLSSSYVDFWLRIQVK